MVEVTEQIRLLSLLTAIGELSSTDGAPEDGVELADKETSMRWLLLQKTRPFASLASLRFNGYQGNDLDHVEDDLKTLIEKGYVALTPVHDAYALTGTGLAIYHGSAAFV